MNDRTLRAPGVDRDGLGYGAEPEVREPEATELGAADTTIEPTDRATEADPATTPSGREEAPEGGDVGGGAGGDTGGGGDATGDGDDRDEQTFGERVSTLRQDVREGLEGLGGGVGEWFQRHPHITEYAPIGVAGASIMAVGSLLSKSFADVPVIGGLLGGLVGGGVKIVGAGLLIFAGANILIREGFGFSSGGDGRVPNTPILDANSVTADPNLPATTINRGPADQIFEAADERLGLDNSYAQLLEEEGKVAEANLMREQISTTRQMLNEQRTLLREDNLTPEQQEKLLASTALAGEIARMPRNEAIDFERLSRDGIASVSAVGDIKNLLAANPDLITQATVMRDSDGDGLDNKVIGKEGVDAIMASGAIRVETSDILGNGIEINSQTAVRNALVEALQETVGDEIVIESEVSVGQAVNVEYKVPELRNPAVTPAVNPSAPDAGSTPDETERSGPAAEAEARIFPMPKGPEMAANDRLPELDVNELPELAREAYTRGQNYRNYGSNDPVLAEIMTTGQLPEDLRNRVSASEDGMIPIGFINGDASDRRFEAVLVEDRVGSRPGNYEIVTLSDANPYLPAEDRQVERTATFDRRNGERTTEDFYPEGMTLADLPSQGSKRELNVMFSHIDQKPSMTTYYDLTGLNTSNGAPRGSVHDFATGNFKVQVYDGQNNELYAADIRGGSLTSRDDTALAAANRAFQEGQGDNIGGNRGEIGTSREALASITRD